MSSNKDTILYNNMIKTPELRVIFEQENLGILPLKEALEFSQSKNLDLVLISSTPPVAKVCDVGKYKYEILKKQKIQKKTGKPIVVKQISLKPCISINDLNTKITQINTFLVKNFRVSFKIKLRTKEMKDEKNIKNAIEFLKNVIHNKIQCSVIQNVTEDILTKKTNIIIAQIGPLVKK